MKTIRIYGSIVTVLLLSAQLLLAQDSGGQPARTRQLTQTIRGIVTDKASGKALEAMTVIAEEAGTGTTTDDNGKFTLEGIPAGRHTVRVSGLGYRTMVVREVLVGSAKEVLLEIGMTEKTEQLSEVVVGPATNKSEALNEMALLGARMFSVEEAGRFAGGMDDPARLVTAYAGVSTPSVTNNGISIHGNAPSLVQWRLEGVEIPNPTHFADAVALGGGLLSGLSSNVLGNSDFLTAAFPAEYNNAISGVFDLNLRTGNPGKHQHTFQLGVLGIDLASEGPISKTGNSSYIVNYRYSTTSLIEKIQGKQHAGGTLDYQDLNFKLNFPTRKAGTFSLWGLGLSDKVDPIPEDPSEWRYPDDGILSRVVQESGAAGLSHSYLFKNGKTSLRTSLALTGRGSRFDEELYESDDNRSPRTDMTARTTNLVLTSALSNKFGPRHTNKTGITFSNIAYRMNLDFTPVFGEPLKNFANSEGSTNLISAYTSSKISLGGRFILSAGLAAQYLQLNKKATIEPRLGLKWRLSSKSSLAVGYGLHSRMESPDVYFVKNEAGEPANRGLDFTKSHHLMLSYNYKLSDDMHIRIEPYYHYLFDVPVSENSSYSIINREDFYLTSILLSKGRGENYGVDLTFEKYLTKGIYYMATASIFQSRYRGGDGNWYNTRYNRNFIINGLIGKEWILGSNVLGVNLRASLLGGQRYSPVDEAGTLDHPDKEVQYDKSRMYSEQFSPMLFTDFSLSYKINRKRVAHEVAIKSVNASSQRDYIGHKYNIKTQQIEPFREATTIFNISYRLEF